MGVAQTKAVADLVQATQTGALSIAKTPDRVFKANAALPADNYDAAMNAVKNNHGTAVQNLSKLNGVAAYDLKNNAGTLYLRDPSAAGLKHSVIGHVFNAAGGQDAYVSIGVRSAPENNDTVEAKYSGALIGTYDGSGEVVADVAAQLNWSPVVKTLEVGVTNAHVATDNMKNGYQQLAADDSLNFSRLMIWDASTSRFVLKDNDGETRAHLYGSKQEEIGGTFDHTVNGKAYSGAFFGTKQP